MNSDNVCLHRQRNGESAVQTGIHNRLAIKICMLCHEPNAVPAPLPMYYSTMLTARDCWPFEFPECSKNNWQSYESNWRILHIDGFECKTLQFYSPEKLGYLTETAPAK